MGEGFVFRHQTHCEKCAVHGKNLLRAGIAAQPQTLQLAVFAEIFRDHGAENDADIFPLTQGILQLLFAGEEGKILHNGHLAADLRQKQGFLQCGVAAADHGGFLSGIEGTVAHSAEGKTSADQRFLSGKSQHPVLHTHGKDQCAGFVAAAFLGIHPLAFAFRFHPDNVFQLHIGPQIHHLLNELFGKFAAADLLGAGDVLHLGGVGDLSAKTVFLDHKDLFSCPKGINSCGKSGGAAADDDNIAHRKSFFQLKGRANARPLTLFTDLPDIS